MDTANNLDQVNIKNTVGVPPTTPKAHQKAGVYRFSNRLRELHAGALEHSKKLTATNRDISFDLLDQAAYYRRRYVELRAHGL